MTDTGNGSNGGDALRFASAPIGLIVFNIIYKMDSKIGFEMKLIVVEAILCGRCASFMVLNGNGFGDIWWTDNLIYFSSRPIDVNRTAPPHH